MYLSWLRLRSFWFLNRCPVTSEENQVVRMSAFVDESASTLRQLIIGGADWVGCDEQVARVGHRSYAIINVHRIVDAGTLRPTHLRDGSAGKSVQQQFLAPLTIKVLTDRLNKNAVHAAIAGICYCLDNRSKAIGQPCDKLVCSSRIVLVGTHGFLQAERIPAALLAFAKIEFG
jgi:hypothetical protein